MIKSKKNRREKPRFYRMESEMGKRTRYHFLRFFKLSTKSVQILENYSNPDLMMISRPILTTLLSKQDSTKSSKI